MSIVTLKEQEREGCKVFWIDCSSRLCLSLRDCHGNIAMFCEEQVNLITDFLAKYPLAEMMAEREAYYEAKDREGDEEGANGD